MKTLDKVYPENFGQSTPITVDQLWLEGILILKSVIIFLQGYSFVAPSIIFGENEFTKRLIANKPSEHRPAPGAVDYAALFEVNVFLCQFER